MPPPLTKARLSRDPVRQFTVWFGEATRCRGIRFPQAMCLSTIDARGLPDARVVLLKRHDARGFVFYTNRRSAKGRALLKRPAAALTWYWEPLRRQVRVQGAIQLVDDHEADAYFRTRPRLSQLAAWASLQSATLADRSVLIRRVARVRRRFQGRSIPRPPFWTGFRVIPSRIEFWQDRPNRLHDRFLFTRTRAGGWRVVRLYP
ncbi:MAG: pyridoxamine 5'-phosphate oxidase [Candidatus Omnitrophica bacterium]|nr:pyridoxamine 5'-phosphate oxidase [Candidatus Omnitrophota bacterium]